jgi:hypothetical protein
MQIYKTLHISALLILVNLSLFSQPDYAVLGEKEEEIKEIFDSLFYRNEIRFLRTDEQKRMLNERLVERFRSTLDMEGSYEYPFNSLIHCGIFKSPDNVFRIYNWNLRFSDGSYRYYGFIQYYNSKKNKVMTWELQDKSDSIPDPGYQMLTASHWWGALYYYIHPYKDGKKTQYILLGWDGNDNFTNKKIVEHLSFTTSGEPRFGKSVFVKENELLKRYIIEYSIRVSVALIYDGVADAIVWDHLAPENSSKTGDLYYYGPDASYDGFKLTGKKWLYIPDIYVTNPDPPKNKAKKPSDKK